MPGIPFPELVNHFVEQLERSSATVTLARTKDVARPARMRVVTGEGPTDCIVFLWTITPGGGGRGVRPANERRIQMTNVSSIPLEPGCRTLLGGWSGESGVFAFWDPRRHTKFSRKSPSLQVISDTLETASHVGIATYLRPAMLGNEVVVAVGPDSLLWYVQHGLPLHNSESDSTAVVDLAEAKPEDERSFLDESENEIQAARRYDLVETMRAYRDARFRPVVLRAYGYKCAVCGCALKLVDAAHIVPVSHPQSNDEVTNGLALCRLHHGAFDNALLGVRSNYMVITNSDAEARLSELRLNMGLPEFKSRLPDRITLPASSEMHPEPENLRLGLQARRWPNRLIA